MQCTASPRRSCRRRATSGDGSVTSCREHLRGQRDATTLHVLVDAERTLNELLLDLRRCDEGALALHDHQPALVGKIAYGLASGRSADAELPTELDL